MLEDFPEPDQDGRTDAAENESVDQLLEIDQTLRILVRMHQNVAVGSDGKIAFAPTFDIVAFRGVTNGPALARFKQHRFNRALGCQFYRLSTSAKTSVLRNALTGQVEFDLSTAG